MGHHRKARSGRQAARTHASRIDEQPADAFSTSPRQDGAARHDQGETWLSEQSLEEFTHAARMARRAGRQFRTEILASADTRQVPAPPLDDGLPRRYATHQPTEPLPTAR